MPRQKVIELLNKQKIVENMLRNQAMRHHDLVENVVHKQHLAELQAILLRLSAAEIGKILETLSINDAQLLWEQVHKEREEDILWEISDSLREQLVGSREPQFDKGQINAYELINGQVRIVDITCRNDLEAIKPIWVDLLHASKSERRGISRYYGLELPDPDELTDLEVSARFYVEENDEIHLHSNFLLDREGESRSVPVAFVMHTNILFTVRNEELPVFRLQRLRARNQPGYFADCKDLLLDLYRADVEYSADALEDSYAALRQVGQTVLSEIVTDTDATRILAAITVEEDRNGLIRSNMLDTQRAVSFLMRGKFLSQAQSDEVNQILRDIQSLNSHTAFLFEKINFLMDATVGFINVNQNQRVSQLTVLGVVFAPLNILAGIGGMSEFSMMTQGISWPVAYGALLVGMVLAGWMTFVALRFIENRKTKNKLSASRLRK
ncbi:MAG: magnesium and cobalt transport protein CorA [Candidatus Competibacteraceae bacterium]